ncbi:NADPH-dependent 2,4-dienoyl-CoA reductase, sulfur reductase, or a related oxidoreductase [Geosmithia morbida]|uniref:NADPH-dependent 2,4-dienoyl-CoA reductase, sulfur reductase, or a related oxidoreductase n=1 Tax=Geosmithia morbida TaxID=1094350 RepID=A0A9P4YP92_9HYPO|nr:NADPH-dependent 2,4-dienoyl-CoA reductase, sulfur reductase, or a related oxidoreductase [Geosmithia morbida]KAF4120195.1 NADPH-dependent 2,4-dienoyl-CoA reductase, sulfur reductase, or a related oxidoreductase [Geosmithia morbida]
MTKTIVVLGAGIAAVSIIRQVMRNVVLPSNEWKLVVVSPNTHLHFPTPMPRVLIPGQIPDDKVFAALDLQFGQYKDADKFEFILGVATQLDPTSKSVTVTPNADGGADRTISYDKLLITTGARTVDGLPWKTLGSTEETRALIAKLQSGIKAAKTIVVAGGGPTGTEMAGELGSEYGKSGPNRKTIHFVYTGARPLDPQCMESVQRQAKTELERLNIKLIPNTKVTASTTDPSTGVTTLQLTANDGKTTSLETDVYLPALGLVPNSGFVPADLLDAAGQIKQTTTLQAEGYPDIFVAGDVGSLEPPKFTVASSQAHHLAVHLPPHLKSGTPIPVYAPDTKNVLAVTLGRSKATGQMKGWKLPSIMVWLLKGRDLFLGLFDGFVLGKKVDYTVLEK